MDSETQPRQNGEFGKEKNSAPATIFDVAHRVGTTPTTVSHALSGKRAVSAAMRLRIEKAVDELGYLPSAAARTLATGRSNIIVLDVPVPEHGGVEGEQLVWQVYLAADISPVLARRGYHVLVLVSTSLDGHKLVQMARSKIADGFILPDIHLADPRVQALRDDNRPFVAIGRPLHHHTINWVDADSTGGAAAAATHLFTLGHRLILFIGRRGHTARYGHTFRLRLGIHRAYRQQHLRWTPALTRYVEDDTATSGYTAAVAALKQKIPFTAIITSTDVLAIGAMRAVREWGLCVPTDISVIGFNDSQLAANAQPPLTCVTIPRTQMGNAAVETLLRQIEHPESRPIHTLIPTTVVVRESTAAVGSEWWQKPLGQGDKEVTA